MADDKALTEGDIPRFVLAVRNGTVTKEQAQSLLLEFVRQADDASRVRVAGIEGAWHISSEVSPWLIEHVRDCFEAYLVAEGMLEPKKNATQPPRRLEAPTLDQAFGLKRLRAGQPPTNPDTLTEVALEVLEARLRGESPEGALYTVAVDRKERGAPVSNEKQINEAWKAYQVQAAFGLHVRRVIDKSPWTRNELICLEEIYKDVEGTYFLLKLFKKEFQNTSRDIP